MEALCTSLDAGSSSFSFFARRSLSLLLSGALGALGALAVGSVWRGASRFLPAAFIPTAPRPFTKRALGGATAAFGISSAPLFCVLAAPRDRASVGLRRRQRRSLRSLMGRPRAASEHPRLLGHVEDEQVARGLAAAAIMEIFLSRQQKIPKRPDRGDPDFWQISWWWSPASLARRWASSRKLSSAMNRYESISAGRLEPRSTECRMHHRESE